MTACTAALLGVAVCASIVTDQAILLADTVLSLGITGAKCVDTSLMTVGRGQSLIGVIFEQEGVPYAMSGHLATQRNLMAGMTGGSMNRL